MTEQEFRELTAYPPPVPTKQNPPVSSIAAAVANKGTDGSLPPVPQIPMAGFPMPPQAQNVANADAPPPSPPVPAVPPAAEHSPLNQFFSQIIKQPEHTPINEAPPVPPAPAHAMVPAPQEKQNELAEQFTRLLERHKHMLEERDALAREVGELKRALAEKGTGRDYKEEIRLLGKLIDNEQSLRKTVVDNGAYKPEEDLYARHDKLVQVFLNIVARIE